MALDTYTNLKSEIADWLDRPDLTARIDTFIDLAEAAHKRQVRIRAMIKRATASLSGRFLALPTGYLRMDTFRLNTDPVTVLKQLSDYELTRVRQVTNGLPHYFAIHEEIEFDRTPDSAYEAEMIYYAPLTALSDSNATNWILTNAPDLYLWGALLQAEPFLDNDERIGTWKSKYDDALAEVNLSDRRSRTSGPQIAIPAGDIP